MILTYRVFGVVYAHIRHYIVCINIYRLLDIIRTYGRDRHVRACIGVILL